MRELRVLVRRDGSRTTIRWSWEVVMGLAPEAKPGVWHSDVCVDLGWRGL